MGASSSEIRMSKFFEVDVASKSIKGPAPYVPTTLQLNLVSVSVDQPQFWPNEQVHLKILMPGRPGARFTATVQKRDANAQQLKGELDGQGAAVLTALDGEKKKLEVGEYRIDLRTEDGKASGSTTFSVIEGTLGAVSLAHDFKQVTSPQELEKEKGAWFMGNAAGAGKRWGNGLNFKNELRVANLPFDGEVKCISRCMLPGCNGVAAGPGLTVHADHGHIGGVMDVGGHSGPFQIEFVTAKGSLRHQFEGSSHVERDMMLASGGVSFEHRAGLAPYQGTEQVSGRQIFVEKKKTGADPFVIESIVAKGGELSIKLAQPVASPVLVVWTPKGDGGFDPKRASLRGELRAGEELKAKVEGPYSLVTIGGFFDGKFREGWAMAFVPAQLSLDLELPTAGAPGKTIKIGLSATEGGAGAAISGILEVFDNRVASKSPFSGLASSIGDSVRNTSNSVSAWQDRTGIDPKQEEAERRSREKADMDSAKEEQAMPMKAMAAPSAAPPPPAPMRSMAKQKMANFAGAASGGGAPGSIGAAADEEEPQELIREGEKKVVYCGLVRTDSSGKAIVEVQLPPQLGRVSVRLVGVRGLDHASAQKSLDVAKKASVEAQLPRTFVPGAQLKVPLAVTNTLSEAVTVFASGTGIQGRFSQSVAPGNHELTLPWNPSAAGKVLLELVGASGKSLDRREIAVQTIASQPVTFSRLVIAQGQAVSVGAGETAIVYPGPGALLKGIVMNMVTTMESWFGHAEALSAQVAARAAILSAISQKLIDDEGLDHSLRMSLDKAVRDLDEAFVDPSDGLVRPYPGLPGDALWSSWTARNLHIAVNLLKKDPQLSQSMASTLHQAEQLAAKIDGALRSAGSSSEERGYDTQGREVIPVEIDGKVVYRVLTDDSVTRWATQKLLPTLDIKQSNCELAFAKAYDTFRFLRAFERVGALQYLTEIATAYWLQGDKAHFSDLFPQLARGMILAQEPGMVQGPATLGGVYSTPMAMVRFLELLVAMARDGKPASGFDRFEKPIAGPTSLRIPDGAVVRIDKPGVVPLMETSGRASSFGKVELSAVELPIAGESALTITLDPSRNPLEYYAIVAVPSTTAVKQTEDILSDYKGQLIYGQQAMGGQKMQLLAVPFRGSRTLRLLLEGAIPGSSPGFVAIRHIENGEEHAAMAVPAVAVSAR